MNSIQIYDPAMCCSSGVCGPDIDPILPQIAGFLHQLQEAGIKVERYNLSQQPLDFLQNPEVKALLQSEGVEALPLIFIDGLLALKGSNPDHGKRKEWLLAHQQDQSSR